MIFDRTIQDMRVVVLFIAVTACLITPSQGQGTSGGFASDVRPFMDRWCISCHGERKPKADLNLAIFSPTITSNDDIDRVTKIRDHLRGGTMPPPKRRRPPRNDVAQVVSWATDFLTRAADGADLGPGRVTVRRLSRFEYDNTTRTLFNLTSDVSETFPRDDLGYGFDNIGAALTTSQLHVERYMAAAEDIALQAISTEDTDNPPARRLLAENLRASRKKSVNRGGDFATLFANGALLGDFELPRRGLYVVEIGAFARQGGDELARMEMSIDGVTVKSFDVEAQRSAPASHGLTLRLEGGRHAIGAAFVNDYYDPDAKDRNRRDRNLYVGWIEVRGPIDPKPRPAAHQWIFAGDSGRGRADKRARKLIERLVRRAWRRPARSAEIQRLCRLVRSTVESGESFEAGMQLALQAILVSPHFLFRLEPGGKGSSGSVQDLDPWALASRLSYFLWSAPPDDRLFNQARNRKLKDLKVLEYEARRMLVDDRADALARNFLPLWLELRNLQDIHPDPNVFPSFDEPLRRAMMEETSLLFRHVMREGLPVSTLLTASFTYVNERLATHYGLSGIKGDDFRHVGVGDDRLGGLLGHAGIHAVTSNPTRTSPVKRGKWILDNIFDMPPPPPPPGEDSFSPEVVRSAASLREQMELHRKEPRCANCHERMDTLGLALENFDGIGRWRDSDRSVAIDASGILPDGTRIGGANDLRRVLASDPAFVRCLLRKMFVYAVGRDTTHGDIVALERVLSTLGSDPTVGEIAVAVVGMDAFRKRVVTQ